MNSKNRFLRAVSCGLLFIALTTSLPAEPLQYLHEGTTQAATVLAPPPLVGSPEQAVDMSAVQTVFHATTPGEAAIAFSEKKFSVYTFASAVGPFFQSNGLPKTTVFFEHVQTDAE